MNEYEQLRRENDQLQQRIEKQLADINATIHDINQEMKG